MPSFIKIWNRKLHFYLGLYFLFFLWLFAFTGLVLNHGSWKFAEFWPNRRVSNYERPIQAPPPGAEVDRARNLMAQLGIVGEIQWGNGGRAADRLEFQASRPGHTYAVKADLRAGVAKVEQTELNAWGIMRILHTFTGVRSTDPANQRDWVLTTVWALSMDAVAAGLVAMVLGGIYMWAGQREKRRLGLAALALGTAVCGWFVYGLRLFSR